MKNEWDKERRMLLGDNAVLKDAANRLNLQMQDAKEQAEKKERRQEKERNGVIDVWDFISPGKCLSNSVEFIGTGRRETDNSRSGRGPQSRALPFAGPYS